jgi:hypothetical protein
MTYPHRAFPPSYQIPDAPASPGSFSMTEYEPICLEEGPDEASTCYLPLGHDVPHDWTLTEPGYSPEFSATCRGLTAVLVDLKRTADQMASECKSPPCLHAWGIRYAVTAVEEAGLGAERERSGGWMDHLGEWHEGAPLWDRCPHGVVGGDVWCHHCEPF